MPRPYDREASSTGVRGLPCPTLEPYPRLVPALPLLGPSPLVYYKSPSCRLPLSLPFPLCPVACPDCTAAAPLGAPSALRCSTSTPPPWRRWVWVKACVLALQGHVGRVETSSCGHIHLIQHAAWTPNVPSSGGYRYHHVEMEGRHVSTSTTCRRTHSAGTRVWEHVYVGNSVPWCSWPYKPDVLKLRTL